MRPSDLIRLAFSNLKRRKTRTVLTVLGVVIGTASIVVMVSLGLGMSSMLLASYQSSGSLTMVTVYGGYGDQDHQLTDQVISDFAAIPHVTGTSPSLSVNVEMRSGAYTANTSIIGVSQDYFRDMELASGSIPKPDQPTLSIVYGNTSCSYFIKGQDYSQFKQVDPEKDTIFFTFPDGYTGSSDSKYGTGGDDGGQQKGNKKKYILERAGLMAGGPDHFSMDSMNIYADIDTFKTFLRKIYKKNLVPNPATNKNGKPLRYYVYDQAYVFVDDMDNVQSVQKSITDMGYEASSNMQWLEQAQQTLNTVQLVLGGIGAVSLLVAAIGIMNTMMMSIYERTRDIGVMKVLGCDMKDIRNMFLAESAIIGLMGGIAGIILSMLISAVINYFTGSQSELVSNLTQSWGQSAARISLIPPWLILAAILFAMVVGSFSGYLPAVRAMKLSPLAAIRNE